MRDDEPIAAGSEQPDERDARIDAALRSYAEPPELSAPRVALARIMEQTRTERPAQPARQIFWWKWGLAGAAACLLVIAAALWVMRAPQVPQIARSPQPPGVVTVPKPPAVAEARIPAIRRAAPAHRFIAHRETAHSPAALPRLAVFPTPQALSPEEQALVAFATNVPPKVQQQVLSAEKHVDDPITIADLKIRPLNADEQQPDSQKERK